MKCPVDYAKAAPACASLPPNRQALRAYGDPHNRQREPLGRPDAFADSVAPAIREAAGANTLRRIAAAINGRGIGTTRGGKWEATTVTNVLRRIG
jgi:hypothetical protein